MLESIYIDPGIRRRDDNENGPVGKRYTASFALTSSEFNSPWVHLCVNIEKNLTPNRN